MWPEPDGMATVCAYLPAADAVGVYAVLDEYARHAGGPGDERNMDAHRADALVNLVLGPTGVRSEPTGVSRDHTGESGSTSDHAGDVFPTAQATRQVAVRMRPLSPRRRGGRAGHHPLHRTTRRQRPTR